MAISRAQLLKELLPGLNALFGLEYARYGEEHKEIYETETSERSFEEEVKLSGFSAAFSLTEEAIEDNLYDSLSGRYTKALARSMAYTKQVRAVSVVPETATGTNAFTEVVVKLNNPQILRTTGIDYAA